MKRLAIKKIPVPRQEPEYELPDWTADNPDAEGDLSTLFGQKMPENEKVEELIRQLDISLVERKYCFTRSGIAKGDLGPDTMKKLVEQKDQERRDLCFKLYKMFNDQPEGTPSKDTVGLQWAEILSHAIAGTGIHSKD